MMGNPKNLKGITNAQTNGLNWPRNMVGVSAAEAKQQLKFLVSFLSFAPCIFSLGMHSLFFIITCMYV